MSLFDIDKTNGTRLRPKPNSNDEQENRMAHNTLGTTYKTESSTANPQRVAFKNGLILTYDSENRVSSAYGYIPALSTVPVFIIANEGYDVFEDVLGLTAPTV